MRLLHTQVRPASNQWNAYCHMVGGRCKYCLSLCEPFYFFACNIPKLTPSYFIFGSHKPNTSLRPAGLIKTDESTFWSGAESNIEKSANTVSAF